VLARFGTLLALIAGVVGLMEWHVLRAAASASAAAQNGIAEQAAVPGSAYNG